MTLKANVTLEEITTNPTTGTNFGPAGTVTLTAKATVTPSTATVTYEWKVTKGNDVAKLLDTTTATATLNLYNTTTEDQTVTVQVTATVGDATDSKTIDLTVKKDSLKDVTVSKPEKVIYDLNAKDSDIDLTGLEITEVWASGEEKKISYDSNKDDFTNKKFIGNTSEPGTVEVSFTYKGETYSFEVTIVSNKPVTSWKAELANKDKLYFVGDTVPKEDVIVTVTYEDDEGDSKPTSITDGFTVTPEKLSQAGKQELTVTLDTTVYNLAANVKQEQSVTITVHKKPSVSITVKGPTDIKFEPTGNTLKATLAGATTFKFYVMKSGEMVLVDTSTDGTLKMTTENGFSEGKNIVVVVATVDGITYTSQLEALFTITD